MLNDSQREKLRGVFLELGCPNVVAFIDDANFNQLVRAKSAPPPLSPGDRKIWNEFYTKFDFLIGELYKISEIATINPEVLKRANPNSSKELDEGCALLLTGMRVIQNLPRA